MKAQVNDVRLVAPQGRRHQSRRRRDIGTDHLEQLADEALGRPVGQADPAAAPADAGEFGRGFTPRGKPGPQAPHGARQGLNDYTGWFAGNPEMAGNYFGYDGPFPPWNDSLVHHYVFTLYALDVAKCGVSGIFKGTDVLAAIKGHVLAQARDEDMVEFISVAGLPARAVLTDMNQVLGRTAGNALEVEEAIAWLKGDTADPRQDAWDAKLGDAIELPAYLRAEVDAAAARCSEQLSRLPDAIGHLDAALVRLAAVDGVSSTTF